MTKSPTNKSIKILGAISILLISLVFHCFAQEATYPKPLGYVSDYAEIIPSSERDALSALCQELEAKTTAQIAIVAIESTYPESIDTYAVNLFSRWGVGQKGKDNGLLIVVAKRDRKVKIEVGYGLEGIIPDAFAHQVYLKQLVPAFRQKRYGEGLLAATATFAKKIAAESGIELSSLSSLPQPRYPPEVKPSLGKRILSTIVSLLFFAFILIFFGPLGLLFFGMGSRGGYWGAGGSGGFGGGFGGFGGGSCGGGGAGGGW